MLLTLRVRPHALRGCVLVVIYREPSVVGVELHISLSISLSVSLPLSLSLSLSLFLSFSFSLSQRLSRLRGCVLLVKPRVWSA